MSYRNPAAPMIAFSLATSKRCDDTAREYVRGAKAENTRRAYRADWQHFLDWCGGHELAALPAEPSTVVLYVSALAADCKVATITRRLAAISRAHQNPAIRLQRLLRPSAR